METIKINIFNTLKSIISNFNSINEFIVKSDDENLNLLLKDPEDKIKFQNAVDEVKRDNDAVKTINIKGKDIKISI